MRVYVADLPSHVTFLTKCLKPYKKENETQSISCPKRFLSYLKEEEEEEQGQSLQTDHVYPGSPIKAVSDGRLESLWMKCPGLFL